MFASKRALLRTIERMEARHAAERAQLLDRIMHLAGRTWEPPPAAMLPVEPEPEALIYDPDQDPEI